MKERWWEKLDLNEKSAVAENMAEFVFLAHGWKVFRSGTHVTPADLMSYEPRTHTGIRLQVKGGVEATGSISLFKGKSNKHPGRDYDSNDFDFLCVVIFDVAFSHWPRDEGVYLIPWVERIQASSFSKRHIAPYVSSKWDGWKLGEDLDFAEEPPAIERQMDFFNGGFK